MSIVVDKIYNDLLKKVEPINKARLENVDMDKILKKDKVHARLRRISELSKESNDIQREISALKEAVRADLGGEYRYYILEYENYISTLRAEKASLITIDRGEIEANVILSDVGDLDSLIANITKGITKDIPELNEL